MDLISASIIGLWVLSVPVRLTAAAVVLWQKLPNRYPYLVLWLTVSATHSAWLMWIAYTQGKTAYGAAISASLALTILAHCLLAMEGFWAIVRDFRSVALTAVFCAACFAAIGMIAVAGSFDIGTPGWEYTRTSYLLVHRHFALFCLAFTVMARLVFSKGLGPVSPNALTYNTALLLYFGGETLGHAVMRASHGSYWIVAAGQYALQAGTMAGYLLWTRLRRASDVMVIDDDVPESSIAGFQMLSGVRKDFRDALRTIWR